MPYPAWAEGLGKYGNAVLMVIILFWISSSTNFLSETYRTIPRAPIATDITGTLIFYVIFFSRLVLSATDFHSFFFFSSFNRNQLEPLSYDNAEQ